MLEVRWLGRVPYPQALDLQLETVRRRQRGELADQLLLLEHPPVITLGRSSRPENLLRSPVELRDRGIEVHSIGRGGDVTYHAPGQLVGYLIHDLKQRGSPDVHVFLRDMEGALIEALGEFAIDAHRVEGMTGVYLDPESRRPRHKIASIGVGVKRWVTLHGFALNVALDLEGFRSIIPCGLDDVEMVSIASVTGESKAGLLERARAAVEVAFRARFE